MHKFNWAWKILHCFEKALRSDRAIERIALHVEESGMQKLECECVGALAQAYEAAGKLKDALQYYNRFIALNAAVHSQERQRAIVEVQARVEIDKADRERARMETIAKDANDRAEMLRGETERQSKELTALALQLVEKNEFLCNLKEEIEPAIKSAKKAKAIGRRIDDHIKSDRDWETFENQFNQVHGGFLRELSARYPSLSPAELKIAVLTRLNLPTKAMANLLCLSTRTIVNHRQAIRKKLRVGSDENLVTSLTGFEKKRIMRKSLSFSAYFCKERFQYRSPKYMTKNPNTVCVISHHFPALWGNRPSFQRERSGADEPSGYPRMQSQCHNRSRIRPRRRYSD